MKKQFLFLCIILFSSLSHGILPLKDIATYEGDRLMIGGGHQTLFQDALHPSWYIINNDADTSPDLVANIEEEINAILSYFEGHKFNLIYFKNYLAGPENVEICQKFYQLLTAQGKLIIPLKIGSFINFIEITPTQKMLFNTSEDYHNFLNQNGYIWIANKNPNDVNTSETFVQPFQRQAIKKYYEEKFGIFCEKDSHIEALPYATFLSFMQQQEKTPELFDLYALGNEQNQKNFLHKFQENNAWKRILSMTNYFPTQYYDIQNFKQHSSFYLKREELNCAIAKMIAWTEAIGQFSSISIPTAIQHFQNPEIREELFFRRMDAYSEEEKMDIVPTELLHFAILVK